MNRYKQAIVSSVIILLITAQFAFVQYSGDDDKFVSYEVDTKKQDLSMYWKDEKNHAFGSIQNLKNSLDSNGQKLVFAMNGGMFKSGNSPQGLFIQQYKSITALDTATGNGNFYLKPNGVFYTTSGNDAVICKTQNFINSKKIKYATQSGPILVIDGQIHAAFKPGSTNVNIRNGVGILPNGHVLFAMSKEAINFYDFAIYFKNAGCRNALYLDGFVSRTYLPAKKWVQTDGNFGVIIGVTSGRQ